MMVANNFTTISISGFDNDVSTQLDKIQVCVWNEDIRLLLSHFSWVKKFKKFDLMKITFNN